MIPRLAHPTLERLAKGFPVIALTGPRQSGKTTLARAAFAGKAYVSLENPDEREFAQQDPRRFLARFPNGAILDEVQRCPALLSWLQGHVDERKRMGDFVLTGSQQFDLFSGISQSLAGRVARVELLPLSGAELLAAQCLPSSLEDCLFQGGYPSLYDRDVSPNDWFANYVATYIERDVRQLVYVRDLNVFQRFVRLCAARSGQLLNLTTLGADCGISGVTAREWLSVLEASYLVLRVPPHHRNFGKRLVKTPKLYFLDSGLMCWLLSVQDAKALMTHPMRGAIFETWVLAELVKHRFNAGQGSNLHFWRDSTGLEVDLVWETSEGLQAVEIKSGTTMAGDWMRALNKWQQLDDQPAPKPSIIYGGDDQQEREVFKLLSWRALCQS